MDGRGGGLVVGHEGKNREERNLLKISVKDEVLTCREIKEKSV